MALLLKVAQAVSAHHHRSNRKKQAGVLAVVLAEICLLFFGKMTVVFAISPSWR